MAIQAERDKGEQLRLREVQVEKSTQLRKQHV